jgi:hypothetical protein
MSCGSVDAFQVLAAGQRVAPENPSSVTLRDRRQSPSWTGYPVHEPGFMITITIQKRASDLLVL